VRSARGAVTTLPSFRLPKPTAQGQCGRLCGQLFGETALSGRVDRVRDVAAARSRFAHGRRSRLRSPARSRPAAARRRPRSPGRRGPSRRRAVSAAPLSRRRRRAWLGSRPISAHPPTPAAEPGRTQGQRASVPAAPASHPHAFHPARPSAKRAYAPAYRPPAMAGQRTTTPRRRLCVELLAHVQVAVQPEHQAVPDPVSYGLMSRSPTVRNGSHRTRRCRRYG